MKAIKLNGQFEPIKDVEFTRKWDKIQENQTIYWEWLTEKQYRSSQHNRYLFGYVYKPFIPDNFNSDQEVHDHFTEMFLTHKEVLDITQESFVDVINQIKDKARLIKPFKKKGNIVTFEWIESTTNLSPKRMSEYIEKIKDFGSTLGIVFEEFNKDKYYS